MAIAKAFKAGDNRSIDLGDDVDFRIVFNATSGKFEITTGADAVLASLTTGGTLAATAFSGPLTGTASNASQLLTGTWAIPGTIGSTTPNTGAFTTGTFSELISATGSAPHFRGPDSADTVIAGNGAAASLSLYGHYSSSTSAYLLLRGDTYGGAGADTNGTANLRTNSHGSHVNAGSFIWHMYDGTTRYNRYIGLKSGTHTWYGATGVKTFELDNSGNGTFAGDIADNGGDFTSTATTFNLLNATVTTLNIGGAATALSIGAATGTCTINNDILAAAGTTLSVGANSTKQGHLVLWDGAGGNTPAYVQIHSPNGTAWYVFVEDDGTLKIHNAAPTANGDGSVVGAQT